MASLKINGVEGVKKGEVLAIIIRHLEQSHQVATYPEESAIAYGIAEQMNQLRDTKPMLSQELINLLELEG